MQINSVNNQNFSGVHIADVCAGSKNVMREAKLYQLTQKDNQFLDTMYHFANVKKLLPGLTDDNYFVWDRIIDCAVSTFRNNKHSAILETQENIPCGILNYTHRFEAYHIDYVATWPIKKGQRTPFAGKILFKEYFEQFLKTGSQRIELSALKFAPFDCVSKYLEMGFKTVKDDKYRKTMILNRKDVKKALDKLDENISSVRIKNGEDENLFKTLDLYKLFVK